MDVRWGDNIPCQLNLTTLFDHRQEDVSSTFHSRWLWAVRLLFPANYKGASGMRQSLIKAFGTNVRQAVGGCVWHLGWLRVSFHWLMRWMFSECVGIPELIDKPLLSLHSESKWLCLSSFALLFPADLLFLLYFLLILFVTMFFFRYFFLVLPVSPWLCHLSPFHSMSLVLLLYLTPCHCLFLPVFLTHYWLWFISCCFI